jgi:hypothetical protein
MRNSLLRMAALLCFVAGAIGLYAQTNQPKAPDSQQPAASQSQDEMRQSQDAKPFNGTIVKEKGKLVLKETTTNMSYQLDDQDKAKQFEGKLVKVTGKLEGKVIHVENIEASEGSGS